MKPGVFVCGHVFRRERTVKLAIHHSDGMWQLTCGKDDHSTDHPDLHLVHPEHLLEKQPELGETLHDLPRGYLVENVDGEWSKSAHDD